MTTVAIKGRTIAADRRVTCAGIVCFETAKVSKLTVRNKTILFGGAGPVGCIGKFKQWALSNLLRADWIKRTPPSDLDTLEIGLLREEGIFYYQSGGWVEINEPQLALGSGYMAVNVAFYYGKSAPEAVAVASQFDTYTGSQIDILSLDGPGRSLPASEILRHANYQ
jgi:hypothetical protein